MSIPKLFITCLSATLLAGASIEAAELSAVTSNSELYKVTVNTGVATLVGSFKLGPNENGLSHIARHISGTLYGISLSKAASHVYSLDDQTAAAAIVHSTGPTAAVGAAVDPTDGSFWFANTSGFVWWATLVRVDLMTGIETYPGFINPTADNYTGLVFDGTGQLFGLNISQNALWRIDKNNPANSSMVGTGLGSAVDITWGATLTFDPATGQILGHAVSGNGLFTVDPTTGVAAPKFTLTPLPSGILAVAAGPGSATCGPVFAYGAGCAGTGGFVPSLGWSGCSAGGQSVSIAITGGLGGAQALVFLGLGQASIPMGGTCTLLISPVLPGPIFLPLGGVGPGAGSVTVGAVLPAAATGAKFTAQAFVIDTASPIGGSASNGLSVSVF